MGDQRIDDAVAEAILTGRISAGKGEFGDLAAFVSEVRSSFGAGPGPGANSALGLLLTAGLSTEKGDLPVTAGSNADGPAEQVAGLPKWRKQNMLQKMWGTRLGRIAVGSIAATLAVGGLGVAWALPGALHHDGQSGSNDNQTHHGSDEPTTVVTDAPATQVSPTTAQETGQQEVDQPKAPESDEPKPPESDEPKAPETDEPEPPDTEAPKTEEPDTPEPPDTEVPKPEQPEQPDHSKAPENGPGNSGGGD